MKPLTLGQKRFVTGVWAAVLMFAVGNEYLEWGLFGDSARRLRFAVMFVGLLALSRFGPKMFEEIEREATARREAERAAEHARDKSNDAAETDRLRHSIGMQSSGSHESVAERRENSAPAER